MHCWPVIYFYTLTVAGSIFDENVCVIGESSGAKGVETTEKSFRRVGRGGFHSSPTSSGGRGSRLKEAKVKEVKEVITSLLKCATRESAGCRVLSCSARSK